LLQRRGVSSSVSVDPEKAVSSKRRARAYSTPWTPGGAPRDEIQVELLRDLAGYMTMYGAPLYRVERRMQFAAETLGIPLSAFYLPSNIMMNIGDGSSEHPSRTTFLTVPTVFNMFKLQEIDKLARNLLKHSAKFQQDQLEKQSTEPNYSISASVVIQEKKFYEEMTELLKTYVTMADPYPPWLVSICAACQCAFIVILFFRGGWADIFVAFFMGAVSNLLQRLADQRKLTQGTTIFISMFIAFVCRMLQNKVFWGWTGTEGFCYDSVVFSALALYMPGFHFTLSMLEVGAAQPVAGAVRLFLGFIRSFQVGYGVSMGSRMAIYLLEWSNILNSSDTASVCPNVEDLLVVDWWRYLFFLPVRINNADVNRHDDYSKVTLLTVASHALCNRSLLCC
jgi:uncharacterized membrane protein YjjP (DUF1212 family)